MTRVRWIALSALACAWLVGAAVAQDNAATGAKDGKALFLDAKCNTCHTLKAAGIEKRKAAAADPAEAKEKEKSDKKPPDLSSVGLDRKADWMGKYLMKLEAIRGDKHSRKFRGTDAELKTVTAWLETQKAPKAPKAK
jgi:mono/diheme cytochrome c family protein